MGTTARHLAVGHRRRRWAFLAGGVVGLCVLVLVLLGAGAWVASSVLLVPHHDLSGATVQVRGVRPGVVTLSRSAASARPGTYGLSWSGGHAIVGGVLSQGSDQVARTVHSVSGRLRPGDQVAFETDVYTGTPEQALGIPFQQVAVPDPLGPMPAWLVGGRGATWVIFVHGIDGSREGGLRVLPTLHALGLPTLLISYRNDAGAPRSPDGLIHLGMTEWIDLQAAAQFALGHGAAHLILFGDSMGGAIVTRFMRLSPLRDRVERLVLDAPALDWQSILDNQAGRLHLPFLAGPVELAVQARIGIDWGSMNEIAHAHDFELPILLFQGSADTLVPPADSRAFARALPDRVSLVIAPGAGHIQSWNVNPGAYDAHLRAFLAPVSPAR